MLDWSRQAADMTCAVMRYLAYLYQQDKCTIYTQRNLQLQYDNKESVICFVVNKNVYERGICM